MTRLEKLLQRMIVRYAEHSFQIVTIEARLHGGYHVPATRTKSYDEDVTDQLYTSYYESQGTEQAEACGWSLVLFVNSNVYVHIN